MSEPAPVRTLPPAREPRGRALSLRREASATAIVAASMVIPFGTGAFLGPLDHHVPLEPRAAWVIAIATLLALAAWCVQREVDGPRRALPMWLAVLPIAHLARPGSPAIAALDAVAFVGIAAFVGLRAPVRVLTRRHASQPGRRFSLWVVAVSALPGPLFVVAWGLASAIVVPAIARALHPAPARVGDERDVTLTTSDGLSLAATYFPGLPGAPAVVLAHGRHDGRDRMVRWARALSERGAHALTYDARGHGASEGAVITFADREPDDVVHALEALRSLSGAAPSALSVMGVSMGGGATLAALPELSRRGVTRVVLLAPASDYRAIVEPYLPPSPIRTPARAIVHGVSWALGFHAPLELVPADGLDEAPAVSVLVLHPASDRTVPAELSERMAASHSNVTLELLDGMGHVGLEGAVLDREDTRARVLAALGVSGSE